MQSASTSNKGFLEQILTIKATDERLFFTSFCCRSDGVYMVIEGSTNRIRVYSSSGTLLNANFGNRLMSRRFMNPSLLTELQGKCVAIFDSADKTIKKISWTEDLIASFKIGIATFSLSTNIYGHMIMAHPTDNHMRLVTIRSADNGLVLHSIAFKADPKAALKSPFYTIYNQSGYLYILDKSRCNVSLYTIDGSRVRCVGRRGFVAGNLSDPTGLCTDVNGNAVVADCHNDRIIRYNILEENGYSQVLVSDIRRPLSLAIDRDNHLVVLSAHNLTVYRYDVCRPQPPPPILMDLNTVTVSD